MQGYKVQGEHFESFTDARSLAEAIMARKPVDDAVIIWKGNGPNEMASPYKAIVRRDGNLVVQDW